ncbi:MAG: NPCBM/NEW2 domain-containing protein [Pseudomonadota bacterium]
MTRPAELLTCSMTGMILLLGAGIAWLDACTIEEAAPKRHDTADPSDIVEPEVVTPDVVEVLPPVCGDGLCDFTEGCLICPDDCICAELAATPPMGWSSWNLFACDVDEALVRDIADAMVDSGMADAGYEYVNLDDCWQLERNEDGVIVADPVRFPGGIAALADYVHERGLKLGVYTCAGALTCEERPGSFGYEAQDMQTYADWGVDFVKVDWCDTEGLDAAERYGLFRDGILTSGREILLSICNWGLHEPWVWGPATGQMWRTSHDIKDGFLPLMYNLMAVEPLAAFAGPGHWNDPDMLEVGNGGMSDDLYRAHMGLWAMFAAPLIAGNDLRAMSAKTLALLTNPEIIAVDQDPAGLQAVLLRATDDVRVYARPLTEDGLRAVLFFNTSQDSARTASITWDELGLSPGTASVRDLLGREELGAFVDAFEAEVPVSGAVMVTIRGTEPLPRAGIQALSDLPFKFAASYGEPVDRQGPEEGLGVPGGAVVVVHIGGRCDVFDVTPGLRSDAGPEGSVTFEIWGDGVRIWASDVVTGETAPVPLQASVKGRQNLKLVTTPAGDSTAGDRALWGHATLTCR